jgi:hypothetical protein
MLVSCLAYFSTLKMEVACTSEMSVDYSALYPRTQNFSSGPDFRKGWPELGLCMVSHSIRQHDSFLVYLVSLVHTVNECYCKRMFWLQLCLSFGSDLQQICQLFHDSFFLYKF